MTQMKRVCIKQASKQASKRALTDSPTHSITHSCREARGREAGRQAGKRTRKVGRKGHWLAGWGRVAAPRRRVVHTIPVHTFTHFNSTPPTRPDTRPDPTRPDHAPPSSFSIGPRSFVVGSFVRSLTHSSLSDQPSQPPFEDAALCVRAVFVCLLAWWEWSVAGIP